MKYYLVELSGDIIVGVTDYEDLSECLIDKERYEKANAKFCIGTTFTVFEGN